MNVVVIHSCYWNYDYGADLPDGAKDAEVFIGVIFDDAAKLSLVAITFISG